MQFHPTLFKAIPIDGIHPKFQWVWTTTKKNLSPCSTRESQGKQKGEGNRIKFDKTSDKTRVVGFFRFPLFIGSIIWAEWSVSRFWRSCKKTVFWQSCGFESPNWIFNVGPCTFFSKYFLSFLFFSYFKSNFFVIKLLKPYYFLTGFV